MSKTNPFNLPPPWNPGYALPQNVDDEGLERHAYTTSWAPRGSFDDPKVGTAGYAVPGYVMEEGYGVGTMTTRWAPRGTYYGPRIKHWLDYPSARVVGRKPIPGGATQVQIQTMAGVEMDNTGGMAPFTAYGQRAARAILDTVAAMPESIRQPQLRAALNAIDPKIWARAEAAASKELKAGVPARVALERGIASAMSMGIGLELVELGRGKIPASRSQLGMVCYKRGRTSLGAFDSALLMDPGFIAQKMPEQMICLRSGYTWAAATAEVPAHWERLRAGSSQAIVPGPTTNGVCPVDAVRVPAVALTPEEQARNAAMAAALAAAERAKAVAAAPKLLEVGPFLLPIAKQVGIHTTLTAEQKKWYDDTFRALVKKAQSGAISGLTFGAAGTTAASSGATAIKGVADGVYPLAKFKRPDDASDPMAGKMFGFYVKLEPAGTPQAGKMYLVYKEYVPGPGLFQQIWNGIQTVRATIHSFVKDALDEITGAACQLVSSPVGKIGAGAVGAYYGGPTGAAAGVKGAEIAADSAACKDLPPCQPGLFQDPVTGICNLPPLPPAAAAMNLTPILLLGGAAVAAYLFLGMKKS